MIDEIYEGLIIRDRIEERILSLFEGKTWETIALALYQILDDIDTADDMCKENVEAFRNMVMKLQAKKNQLLFSPDGYVVKRVDEQKEVIYKGKKYIAFTLYFPDKKQEILSNLRDEGIRAVIDTDYPDGILVPVSDEEKAKKFFNESKLKEHLNDDGSGDTKDIDDVRPKKSRPPKKKKLTPEEWKKQFSDPIRYGGKESILKERFYTIKYIDDNDEEKISRISADDSVDAENILTRSLYMVKEPGVKKILSTESGSVKENLTDYARNELKIAGLFDKDSDYDGMLGEATIALIELFAKQGHSGFSASLVRELFSKLSNYKPLTEITNNPEEWMNVEEYTEDGSRDGGPMWQSRRSPSLFSTDEGKTYWDIDEDYFFHTDEDGTRWSGAMSDEEWDKRPIHTSKDYEQKKT